MCLMDKGSPNSEMLDDSDVMSRPLYIINRVGR